MYEKRIKGSRKFNERLERARAGQITPQPLGTDKKKRRGRAPRPPSSRHPGDEFTRPGLGGIDSGPVSA